jgi:HlyD family type I secretion membrane fusion protein
MNLQSTNPTFAALLAQSEADFNAAHDLRRYKRHAYIPLAVTAGLLILWTTWAPLSGAVIAPGKLKAELNRKTVQHQEGGIVREILVRDGERVRKGQPLVVIGDVRSDAELSLLQDQLAAERVRHARASAEAAFAPAFVAPAESASSHLADGYLKRETALFNARRRTLNEQISALEGQIRDARQQAAALNKQIEATEVSAKLAGEELQLNEKVVREGFVPRARLLQLQRDEADYRGRLSESQSELALARQRAGDLQARIAQARNQYQQQATDEAREAAASIREIEERVRPSQDEAERRYVRAPVDGKVMSLRVASVGEAIGPRDPILDIVPTDEKLVVEAHIRPQDINHVREQSAAEVRLSSFDARTTPLLPGKVTFVSADRVTVPESGQSWFVATVEVDGAALVNHPEIELQAGMPAELFVTTPERTLFQYLAKPLNAFASRAMREP